jgi:hypothetical protein
MAATISFMILQKLISDLQFSPKTIFVYFSFNKNIQRKYFLFKKKFSENIFCLKKNSVNTFLKKSNLKKNTANEKNNGKNGCSDHGKHLLVH